MVMRRDDVMVVVITVTKIKPVHGEAGYHDERQKKQNITESA